MYIRELQTPKQKKPSSKGRAGAGRRTLTVMVFMRLGYTPQVITCTGSNYPGMPKLQQFRYQDSGKLYTSLGNIEYQAGINKALTHLTSQDSKARSLRSGPPVVLLHDNDTATLPGGWLNLQPSKGLPGCCCATCLPTVQT